MQNFLKKKLFLLLFLFLFIACNNEDSISNKEYVNNWILQNMRLYYLWNNEIPNKPNKTLPPEEFFNSLLSGKDRFSWIQDNYQELLNSLQGVNKEAGYEFVLYRESASKDNVIAQIVYIKPNSPASAVDLLRGDVITKINGQQLTLSNYQSLLALLNQNHSITYQRFIGGSLQDKGSLSLTVVEYAENPNFFHSTYTVGSRKAGYYIYNFFADGPTDESTQYQQEMDQIFNGFKNEGITDLILDLRYNSGGSETSAINLASLIGTNIDDSKVFSRKRFNDEVTDAIINDPALGSDFLVSKFLTKAENIGPQLSGKVYVLTKNRTASASELVINGLKPYMEVIIIGDTTVGKNVGSISIYEPNDPRNNWGMQPIVVKFSNSLNESDYSDGFIPNIANKDNGLELLPLGDPNENLLGIALAEVAGSGGRISSSNQKTWGPMLGTSLDKKRRSFNVRIESPRLRMLLNKQME